MFDIGTGELLLILVVVLLLFGPKKIPEIMASVGKGIRQFRQAQNNLKDQLRDLSADIEKSTEPEVAPKRTFSVVASYNDEAQTDEHTTTASIEPSETNENDRNSAENTVTIRQPEGTVARVTLPKSNESETSATI